MVYFNSYCYGNMWILTPLQPGGETHYLLPGKEYVVGRKNCHILLHNDQSISRAHAQLNVTQQTLTLKDTSKYGSFINGQQVAENTSVILTSGNNITFGVFNSKFSVEKLVVCSSCLDNDGKASLSQALQHVGGALVSSWTQDCTHLAMSTVKVTIKTICALLCCRPIVKPEFFSTLHSTVQNESPPPEVERFLPEIDEPSLNKEEVNLGVIQKRRELFVGKMFIFLNAKQLKRLSAAVTFGGGRCRLLEEGSLPRDVLESAQTCVVDAATGSSQPMLSSSAVEWVKSVKSIVEKKGLRLITESEIGLAAIYASCEKHCNSSHLADGESVPKVKARIPSASLSQSVAVDETVLPVPPLNITAYAVNTVPSQGPDSHEVSGVAVVGETPERRQKSTKRMENVKADKKSESQYFVAESQRSSLNAVEQTESKRTVEESKLTEEETSSSQLQPFFAKPSGGGKIFSQKQSPLKSPAQGSPSKQSSLKSFFQPIKKRQLEDDISPETSQPKRCATSINSQPPKNDKETHSERGPTEASQSSRGAPDTQNKAQGQKRKEMEEEIELDELESLMSEDMDCFDEPLSRSQSQAKLNVSDQQTTVCKTETSSKRRRLQAEQDEGNRRKNQQFDLEKPSTSGNSSGVKIKEQNVSVNIDTFRHSENKTENGRPSNPQVKAPVKLSAEKKQNKVPDDDRGSDYVEDLELLKAVATEVPVKPATVKQELKESKMDDSLPKNLLLVEFRDLKVTEPPTRAPQQKQSNGFTKNFKCFRKVQMRGLAPVIRGADLLAHNRGRNSDLDGWLRDAAEEELQSRQDESVGDDLFRYNPSKLARRR